MFTLLTLLLGPKIAHLPASAGHIVDQAKNTVDKGVQDFQKLVMDIATKLFWVLLALGVGILAAYLLVKVLEAWLIAKVV